MNHLQDLQHQVKLEKKRLSKSYKAHYKHFLITIDCLIIIAFLFNLGSIALTNALVAKNTPDIELIEANPVQAKANNLKTSQLAWVGLAVMFLKQIVPWTILGIVYVINRYNVYSHASFMVMTSLVLYLLVATSVDFFNNLGYFVGLN